MTDAEDFQEWLYDMIHLLGLTNKPFSTSEEILVAIEEAISGMQSRIAKTYVAWMAVKEMDMGDHYIIQAEQYDALQEAISR